MNCFSSLPDGSLWAHGKPPLLLGASLYSSLEVLVTTPSSHSFRWVSQLLEVLAAEYRTVIY